MGFEFTFRPVVCFFRLQRSLGWLIGVTLLALCCEAGTAELASPQYLGTRKMPPLDVNKLIPRYEPHHIGRSDRDVRRQAEVRTSRASSAVFQLP